MDSPRQTEFRDAIIAIEKRQAKLSKDDYRLSWLDSLISFYQQYVDFLIAQKHPDRALEAAESSRAGMLLTSQPIPQTLRLPATSASRATLMPCSSNTGSARLTLISG